MTAAQPHQQARVDKALEERAQQYRRYRAAKKAEYEELFAACPCLRKFQATLNHFGIADADRMVEYVKRECNTGLREMAEDIRFAALQMVGHRIVRIREKAGLASFDDALPGEPDDVWQLCKRELGL